jgi:hypothetical protein
MNVSLCLRRNYTSDNPCPAVRMTQEPVYAETHTGPAGLCEFDRKENVSQRKKHRKTRVWA